jgi:HEAT repeat protein
VQRGAVRPLIRMLEATDPQLREMAAFALGRLAQVLTTATALVSELAEFLLFLSL